MKAVNKGFTLIELMIVVAVIGVLAAIAIPQYQNYVAKAELGTALSATSSLKTNVEDYIANNGTFPDGTTANQSPADLGATQPNTGVISFDKPTTSIKFTFNPTGNSEKINNAVLSLQRTAATGAWTCSVSGGTNITSAILPKGC
ncbi:MAG: pilin [Plesiomonas shigelloides]